MAPVKKRGRFILSIPGVIIDINLNLDAIADVSHPPRGWLKAFALQNISLMSVTLLVTHRVRSASNKAAPSKVALNVVTLATSQLPKPLPRNTRVNLGCGPRPGRHRCTHTHTSPTNHTQAHT